MNVVEFWVYGIPQTKGSAKAFMRPGMRYPVVTNDNAKNKGWAATVAEAAQEAKKLHGCGIIGGAVKLQLMFYLPRPKSLPKRVIHATKRPDLDKMIRSVKDALTGVFYLDDAQVTNLQAGKQYADQPGVIVTLEEST